MSGRTWGDYEGAHKSKAFPGSKGSQAIPFGTGGQPDTGQNPVA